MEPDDRKAYDLYLSYLAEHPLIKEWYTESGTDTRIKFFEEKFHPRPNYWRKFKTKMIKYFDKMQSRIARRFYPNKADILSYRDIEIAQEKMIRKKNPYSY